MKRTVLDFGFVGLLAVALVGGCSSSGGSVSGSGGNNGSGGNSSSGGSNGSGGSSSGGSHGSGGSTSSGGSNGSGGSSSGSGGSSSGSGGDSGSGSGGSGTTACAAASGDGIQDFDSTGITGTIYAGAQTGLSMPTFTSSGSLQIMFDTGVPTMMYPYAYVGLPFNNCVDASQYQSVTFNVSGTLSTGCTIQFSIVDKEHNKVSDGGTCTLDNCYPGGYIFTLPSSATDVTVKFSDQPQGGADASAAAVDPTQLKGIQWQVNPDATNGCTGMVTIDNIKFGN